MEGDIAIGAHTIVGAYAYLKGPLVIGEKNQIGHHVMLGVDPEHKIMPPEGRVLLGNGNVIREFSVIQRGIGDRETEIENDCYIMAYAYIAHDCLIESNAILCARVSLSGHCHILKGAILGLCSSFHQYSTVGAHAFVGMGSIVVKDIPPFCVVMGNPAQFAKYNVMPLEELGMKLEDLQMQHPYYLSCMSSFHTHARRKILG